MTKGLSSFRSGVASVVTWYLANEKDLKIENVAGKPNILDGGLESYFGKISGKLVEESIVAELKAQFKIVEQCRSISDCIRIASAKRRKEG